MGALHIENDHNVYILGAGFSAEAGLPLMSSFMHRMRDAYDWLTQNGRRPEADAISRVLEFRLKAASAALRVQFEPDNIEDLFSLAAASGADAKALESDMRVAIAATLAFARTGAITLQVQIARPGQKPAPAWTSINSEFSTQNNQILVANPHSFYVAALCGPVATRGPSSKNTFISFNYDTVLEEALTTVGIPFDYCLPREVRVDEAVRQSLQEVDSEAELVRVLKLHGSVNWGTTLSPGPMTRFSSYDDLRRAQTIMPDLLPALLPPTWRKVFEGPMSSVWDAAVEALRSATRIIVIGFSIPPGDIHFKYLLAAGLRQSISLRDVVFVDPAGETIKDRASRLLMSSVRSTFHPFNAREFFKNANHLLSIGRSRSPEWAGSVS